ncbi:MAG TPA: hypothetical protein VI756_16875 [Blastocatellia bacterium]
MPGQTKQIPTLRTTALQAFASPIQRETRWPETQGASQETCPRRSPLADLVNGHLQSKRLRQVDFCRQTAFDQGLLSKILSSVVTTLNVETALKLAEGMSVPPSVVFDAIGKRDVHETLIRLYSGLA